MRYLIIFLFVLSQFCIAQTNYYVNATTGNAAFDGLTPTTAKALINDLYSTVTAGDTVNVAEGAYYHGGNGTGPLFAVSGSALLHIVVRGTGDPQKTILHGMTTSMNATWILDSGSIYLYPNATPTSRAIYHNYFPLKRVANKAAMTTPGTFSNDGTKLYVWLYGNANPNTINPAYSNSWTYIDHSARTNTEIWNMTLVGGFNITYLANGNGHVLKNCIVLGAGNGRWAIELGFSSDLSNSHFINSLLYLPNHDSDVNGYVMHWNSTIVSTSNTIKNCVIMGGTAGGLNFVAGSVLPDHQYNLFWDVATPITGGTLHATEITGTDPLFEYFGYPLDLNTQPTSPLLNAGVNVGYPFVGTAPDIGVKDRKSFGYIIGSKK